MSSQRLADQRVIDEARKHLRLQRRAGTAIILLAIVMIAVIGITELRLYEKLTSALVPQDPQPVDGEAPPNLIAVGYLRGFSLGLFVAATMWLVIVGVIISMRKNRVRRLLLRLWDERHEASGSSRTD